MRHGIVLFTSDRGITPAQAAKAAEDSGFDTFYVPEHTHIPARRTAAHPGTGHESLPDDRDMRTLDPWVSLATAAAVTERIGSRSVPASAGTPTSWPSWAWPKPVQDHVPLLIGAGGGPKTFAWIARHAGRLGLT